MAWNKCIIKGCGSCKRSSRNRDLDTSFHEIPSSSVREKWLKVINMPNVKAESKVCSKHFQESDFKNTLKRRVLKPDAVPSLFVNKPPSLPVIELCKEINPPSQQISQLVAEELRQSSEIEAYASKIACVKKPLVPLFSELNDVSQEPSDIITLEDHTSQELFLSTTAPSVSKVLSVNETYIIEPSEVPPNGRCYASNEILSRGDNISTTPPDPFPCTSDISVIREEETHLSSYPISVVVDHSYSISPEKNKPDEQNTCDSELNPVIDSLIIPVENFQGAEKIWSGPEAFDHVITAQNSLEISTENQILKKKILELNLQYKNSFNSLNKKCHRLQQTLQTYKEKKSGNFLKTYVGSTVFQCNGVADKQFAKLKKDAKEKNNVKAKFLLDQVKMYGKKTFCSSTTFEASKIWFEKDPESYTYVQNENILTLPFKTMFLSATCQSVYERIQRECVKLKQEAKYVTMFLDIMEKACFDDEVQNYLVAFALVGLNCSLITPCGFYCLDRIDEVSLSSLVRNVIFEMEEIGFTVVRLICSRSSLTSSLFRCLGMFELPEIVHPCDPTRKLFLSYDANSIVRDICDTFMSFSIIDSEENVRKKIEADFQRQRCEMTNPASYYLVRLMKKKVKGLSVFHQVDVLSGPVEAALAELRKKDIPIYIQNYNFLGMLERWQSFENILRVSQNSKANTDFVPMLFDDRITWLEQNFGGYLQSVKEGHQNSVILSHHKELLNDIILCNASTILCSQYLSKVFSSFPLCMDEGLNSQKRPLKYGGKRLNSSAGACEPKLKKVSLSPSKSPDFLVCDTNFIELEK